MTRKILAIVLSMITVLSVCTITLFSAFAASPSTQVSLTTKQTSAVSSNILTTATTASIYNASTSAHRVYGIIQYKSGTDNYVDDGQVLVSPGKNETVNSKSSFLSSKYWRLELNPYGLGSKSCTADGTISAR